ncbi:MAG: hypothetical protein Q9159_003145 [Coniocarpon cinnabarinum]
MDALLELLYGPRDAVNQSVASRDDVVIQYAERLSTLSVSALTSTEPETLSHDHQSLLRSLQALVKRSYKSVNASAESVTHLRQSLPSLSTNLAELQTSIPRVESKAVAFSDKYAKPTENPVLDRRRRAMRLGENVDKISDVLELPALLQSTIAASSSSTGGAGASSTSTSANASYAQALDLYAHIKRLQKLYPDSAIIASINDQAEEAMRGMTTRLLSSLRAQNLKLANAMRLIGLLRRVAPELEEGANNQAAAWSSGSNEGSLGLLFLVSRLMNLNTTLEALEPLQDLADQETQTRQAGRAPDGDWAAGQQTERYLKRHIEVFREQCFAIVSMYKSIFPASLAGPTSSSNDEEDILNQIESPNNFRRSSLSSSVSHDDPMLKIPSALSAFTLELVEVLLTTLKTYLPNVRDHSSRDSLLTQVLYCAGSLGRLGGDFSLMLSVLQEDLEAHEETKPERTHEWIEVTQRHRVQAGRLELLASGVGRGKQSSAKEVSSAA